MLPDVKSELDIYFTFLPSRREFAQAAKNVNASSSSDSIANTAFRRSADYLSLYRNNFAEASVRRNRLERISVQPVKTRVTPSLSQQLLMVAAFDNPFLFHDHNAIAAKFDEVSYDSADEIDRMQLSNKLYFAEIWLPLRLCVSVLFSASVAHNPIEISNIFA